MDFTFLTKEQIFDYDLDIFRLGGCCRAALATDLTVILGAYTTYYTTDLMKDTGSCCNYYTRSTENEHNLGDNDLVLVTRNGSKASFEFERMFGKLGSRHIAARPILSSKEATKIYPRKKEILYGRIPVVKYGEYPQMLTDERTSAKLEKFYRSASLSRTGKKYTLGCSSYKKTFYEYLMDGKKYIRIIGDGAAISNAHSNVLSNGKNLENKAYWVQVQPIEWLQDKSGALIAKKCLFSGIPMEEDGGSYNGNFERSYMKKYLDKYFAHNILPFERSASRSAIRDEEETDFVSRSFADVKSTIKEDLKKEEDEEAVIWGSGAPKKADIRDYDEPDDEDYDEPERKEPFKKKEPSMRQKKYEIEVLEEPMSVKDQINFYIQNGMSFMLHDPSGVGKSQRVKEIDPNLTSIMLCNGILPEDVIGKTIYPNGGAEGTSGGVWVAPKWYDDLCKKCKNEPNKQHVLFIDEVTNARETTQSLIYHVALEKSIAQGVGQLPDNSVVVLAGNSKEESGAAYNMPAPLFRRLSHIYLDLNIKDWLEWGSEKSKKHPEDPERLNIHPIISSFVATYGERVFYSQYDEEDPKKFALDPRKWEKVSDKIYAGKGVIRREILEADIGRDLSAHLLEYAKNPPLTLEEVVEGEYSRDDIPEVQDAKLALALSLRHASPKQVKKVRKFIEKNLGAENRAIFDSVWVGNDDSKAIQLAVMQNRTGER